MKLVSRNAVALGANLALHHLTGARVPLSATIQITNRCNFRCRYCSCDERRIPEMTTPRVERLIDALHRFGTRKIGFTGGEPLLRKDIFSLLAFTHRKGLITHLVTNASLLDEANVSLLKGLDTLFISYEGPLSVQKQVRRGTTGDTLDKIRLARKNGITVCALATIMKQNIRHIDFIMDRSREVGFPVLFSPLHRHLCSAPDLSGLEPGAGGLAEALNKIIAMKKRGFAVANSYSYLHSVAGTKAPPAARCYAGKLYLVIDANGDIYPCWPAMGSSRPMNFFEDGFEGAIARTAAFKCAGCNFACHQELNFMLSLRPDAVLNMMATWHRQR